MTDTAPIVSEPTQPSPTEGSTDNIFVLTRKKILHVLDIYPACTGSMIQTGIGTSLPPSVWRPILAELVDEGAVRKVRVGVTSPLLRYHMHEVYVNAKFDYEAFRELVAPPTPDTQAAPAPDPTPDNSDTQAPERPAA